MADIFDLNKCSFVANINWRAVEGHAGRFRLGKACVAEIERRRAILDSTTFDGLPILADYIGTIVAESRRALVVLVSDDGRSYFVGDFVQGIININTDLVVDKENIENVIDAKLSEMGYSSPDIFVQKETKLNILEGFGVKHIAFGDADSIDKVSHVALIGVPAYLVFATLGILGVVALAFFFFFTSTRQDSGVINAGDENAVKLTRVTENYSIDWASFYAGCPRTGYN